MQMQILGPSGCGKTSLLQVLAGRQSGGDQPTGRMYLNGESVTYSLTSSQRAGFVSQEPFLMQDVSVREYLMYCALLTHDQVLQEADIEELVDRVMEHLCICHVSGSSVAALSSGERKRVSIASDSLLLRLRSRLLFLDEPTSGLSARDAMDLFFLLHQLAHVHGFTVVLSVHQPRERVFLRFFDRVLLMAANHRVVYFGSPTDMSLYFRDTLQLPLPPKHTADTALDVLSDVSPEKRQWITDKWQHSASATALREQLNNLRSHDQSRVRARPPSSIADGTAKMDDRGELAKEDVNTQERMKGRDSEHVSRAVSPQEEASGSHTQSQSQLLHSQPSAFSFSRRKVWLLFRQLLHTCLRDRNIFLIPLLSLLAQTILVALFWPQLPTTISYGRDRFNAIDILLTLQETLISVWGFLCFRERPRIEKEMALSYYTIEAHLAWVSILILRCAVCAGVALIGYFIVGFKLELTNICVFHLIEVLITTIQVLILHVSAWIMPNADLVTTGYIAMLFLISLFSGYAIRPRNIVLPLRWLVQISPLRAMLEATVVQEFRDQVFTCDSRSMGFQAAVVCPVTGDALIAAENMQTWLALDFFILMAWVLLLVGLSAYVGAQRVRRFRRICLLPPPQPKPKPSSPPPEAALPPADDGVWAIKIQPSSSSAAASVCTISLQERRGDSDLCVVHRTQLRVHHPAASPTSSTLVTTNPSSFVSLRHDHVYSSGNRQPSLSGPDIGIDRDTLLHAPSTASACPIATAAPCEVGTPAPTCTCAFRGQAMTQQVAQSAPPPPPRPLLSECSVASFRSSLQRMPTNQRRFKQVRVRFNDIEVSVAGELPSVSQTHSRLDRKPGGSRNSCADSPSPGPEPQDLSVPQSHTAVSSPHTSRSRGLLPRKVLLHRVWGMARPGEVLAIMGRSGAGNFVGGCHLHSCHVCICIAKLFAAPTD